MTVIVVGAGPTGLMLAGDLAAAGIDVKILEKRAEESNLTRAFALHARTLELFDMRGIADEIVEQGFQVPRVQVDLGTRTGGFDLRHPESRFPYVLMVQQARTEVLLARRAEKLGVPIIRGAELIGLAQDADGVTVTIQTADGEREERASRVVGTDGAHSKVRQLLGVDFGGHSYPTQIMLADIQLKEEMPNAVNPYIGPDGVALLPPYGDGWFRATVWDRTRQGVAVDEPLTKEEMAESLRRISGGHLTLSDMRWSTRFQSERRQAKDYRIGRVLLAGDAAHVHSPMGAMGMNTGIQDAANLAWKIAATEQGWAPDWLLDTYTSERHPVGRATLRLTNMIQRVAVAPAAVRAIRPYLVPRVLGNPSISRRLRLLMSGLGISYDTPPAVTQSPMLGNRVDDVPLTHGGESVRLYELIDPTRFTLVDTTGQASAAAGPWSDRVRIHDVDGALPEGAQMLLLRPDGYVAWHGTNVSPEQVRTILAEWSGQPRELA